MQYLLGAIAIVMLLTLLLNLSPQIPQNKWLLLLLLALLALSSYLVAKALTTNIDFQEVMPNIIWAAIYQVFTFALVWLVSYLALKYRGYFLDKIFDFLLLYFWLMFGILASMSLGRGIYLLIWELPTVNPMVVTFGSYIAAAFAVLISYICTVVVGYVGLMINDKS